MSNLITRGIFVATVCVVTATGSVAQTQRGFVLNVNAFLDSTRSTATRVTVEVPLHNLIFLKKKGLFDARFEVQLSISPLDSDGRPSTYVLLGSATVQTYEETKKSDVRARASRTIKLDPGDYRVDARLHVKHTRRYMRQSVTLNVPNFLSSGIGFGTPKVLSVVFTQSEPLVKWEDFVAESRRTEPQGETDPALAAFDYQPAVRFALYLDTVVTDPVPCDVFYQLVDARNEQVLYGKRTISITGHDDTYLLALNVDRLEPGTYVVNLRVETGQERNVATVSTKIRVDVTRSMLGANFDETVDILSLIASDEELRALKDADVVDRPAEWSAFWKQRDPDVSTVENEALEEHMRRINYVTRNFSKVGDGWRTDRGRIYIRFGQPEDISTSTDRRNQGEYLVWRYYNINRTFVFYDMFGLGDYRLVQGAVF